MARTITLFVALLCSLAAAFFSYSNMNKAIAVQKQNVKLSASIDKLNKNINETTTTITKQTEVRDGEETQKGKLTGQRMDIESQVSATKAELPRREQKIKKQTQDLENYDKALAEIQEVLGDVGVEDPEEIEQAIQQMEQDKIALRKELEETETLVAAAQERVEAAEGRLGRLGKTLSDRRDGIVRNTVETTIVAVNNDWGFVVVGAGKSQGFNADQALLVKRGNTYVARLAVVSLENNRIIADIAPDSLAPGARVMPGDRVIIETPNR